MYLAVYPIAPKDRKRPPTSVNEASVNQSKEGLQDDTDDLDFWFGSEGES